MSTTTLEQSKHLIKLGLNINTADSYWQHISDNDNGKDFWKLEYIQLYWKPIVNLPDTYVYAWSFDALWKIIQDVIKDRNNKFCDCELNKHSLKIQSIGEHVICTEYKIDRQKPTEAAYKMVCWLLENKYI